MSTRRLIDLVLVAALSALGGLGFVAAFDQADLLQPMTAAAVAGVLVSALVTGVGRQGVTTTLLVAVPALFAAAVGACGIPPGDLVSGLTDGPRTILTSTVPAPGEPELLLVPFVVVALVALLGAELTQRSRLAVAPALAPLVGMVVGLAFGGDGRFPPLWIPGAWVLVAAVLTGWRSGGTDADAEIPVARGAHSRGASRVLLRMPSIRAVATVLLVAVPLAGCARWLGPRLPGAEDRERFDLRGLVDQPAQAQQVDNPLVAVTAWQDGPDDELFKADTTERVDRWRLAVLDNYDGVEWRSTAGFLSAGNELPPAVLSDADDESASSADSPSEVTETVEPTGLGGRWLPVADRAVEISEPGLLFDRSGGVLLVDGPELPARYTVGSEVPQLDPEKMVSASAATDDEAQAALALPENLPPDIETLADEIIEGTGSAYGQAAAIERFLAATPGQAYELAVEDPPSGHSVGHIRCFLFAPEQCARQGSTEQFVATYALLARAAGLPTRVVVGFKAGAGPGEAAVSAHDATAWAEVKFEGLGWVAFDPVPDPNVEITPPTTGVAGATATSQPTPPTTVDLDVDDTIPPMPDDPVSQSSSDSGKLLMIIGAVVAVAALVLAFPALWRARRRRRRRNARTAEGRVAGAWAAALDELAATGTSVTRAMAVADVVGAGRDRLGATADALHPLGALVNRTHFAITGAADGADREAWSLSDRFRRERRAGRPLVRRLREYLTIRSSA